MIERQENKEQEKYNFWLPMKLNQRDWNFIDSHGTCKIIFKNLKHKVLESHFKTQISYL